MGICRRCVYVVVSSFLLAGPLFAARPAFVLADRQVDAAVRGQLVESPGTADRAEVLTFGAGVASELLGTAPEQGVRVTGWPVAPGRRADVFLVRHEIYAAGAKIFAVHKGRATEVPRSRLSFLWGTVDGDTSTQVFVAVDPDTAQLDGFSLAPGAVHEIHPLGSAKLGVAVPGIRQYLLAPPEVFLEQAGEKPTWTCGQHGAPLDFLLDQQGASKAAGDIGSIGGAAITSLHTAVLAVDTDNELLFNKFSDNTTSATNYIASLIAQMNVIYQRDLLIQLVQGTTFLRVGNSGDGNHFNDDPWVQPPDQIPNPPNPPILVASQAQLGEVTSYWSTTNGGITRAFVAMLSGKGNVGASGIAWVPNASTPLCNQGSSVSFSQVYLAGTTPSFGDVLVVAHEIGHNFGTPHTHCYNPPIDTCYNGESGCYSGATSCPAPTTINGVTNVTGTLMSYCHVGGLHGTPNCTSSQVFHPTTVALLQPKIQSAVGSCIFPAAPALAVSAVNPNNGSTAGGTAVTISGSGFVSGATVTIGGSPATSVVFVNATTLTAVTPAHATGKVSVTVTNPDASNATFTNGFFYAPPPAQTSFFTLTPCRVLDTRNPNGPLGGPALGAAAQRTFTAVGTCGIPSGTVALATNVTIVSPTAAGSLTNYPGNAFPLGTSVINFAAGNVRANNAILELATDGTGTFGILNSAAGTTNVVVDAVGYFK